MSLQLLDGLQLGGHLVVVVLVHGVHRGVGHTQPGQGGVKLVLKVHLDGGPLLPVCRAELLGALLANPDDGDLLELHDLLGHSLQKPPGLVVGGRGLNTSVEQGRLLYQTHDLLPESQLNLRENHGHAGGGGEDHWLLRLLGVQELVAELGLGVVNLDVLHLEDVPDRGVTVEGSERDRVITVTGVQQNSIVLALGRPVSESAGQFSHWITD